MQERIVDMQSLNKCVFSDESMDRKARSILRLKIEKVPVAEHLPAIEDTRHVAKRSKEEICRRATALCLVSLKGEGARQETLTSLTAKYEIESAFSPNEYAFIKNPEPSQSEKMKFAWRYEGYWVLLWALGYIDELSRPDKICNVHIAVSTLSDRNMGNFIRDARLRRLNKMLDHADLTYRYHWAVVNARTKGQNPPTGLDGDVVMERHCAFNWLTGRTKQIM